MLLLIFFSFFLLYRFKQKSVTTILVALQVSSLSAALIIGKFYTIDTGLDLFNELFTLIILVMVIAPWIKINNIREIVYINNSRIIKLTNFLLVINLAMFFPLIIISIFNFQYIDQIQYLKYSGDFQGILYAEFPILVKGYLLAYYFHTSAYFLIVLHFYYLSHQKTRMSIYCFVLSLNLILFGFTFFSRWTLVNYLLVYLVSFYFFGGSISNKFRKSIKKTMLVIGGLLVFVFAVISFNRFDIDTSYSNTIPIYSIIQNRTIYSLFDYLAQWYENGMVVLKNYRFETSNGINTFSGILNLLSQYGIGDTIDISTIRYKQFGDLGTNFLGLVANWVYDFGYVITFALAVYYNYVVRMIKPKTNKLPLINALLIVLLIQIPLLAVFYSRLGGLIIPLFVLIPIYFYLYKGKIKI